MATGTASDPEALAAFRDEVRAWLEAHCPASMRQPYDPEIHANWGGRKARFPDPDVKLWMDRMIEKGWTAPTWPAEYGGGGLTPAQAAILHRELQRINARPALTSIGFSMLGPVLLEFGTEEQKREHLPRMVRGEIRWCQGYSEPGAGSDLASLQMRCEDRGDHYVANGQKIWTSYANESDMIFCLVRTDPAAPKHDGISFVLIDMDQPGVTTSPIRLISGSSPFCQTFFDDARVEKRNLVGGLNRGWTVAKRLLQYERQTIGAIGQSASRLRGEAPLHEIARRYCGSADGRVGDPLIRDRLARLEMDLHCLRSTMRRSAEEARAGGEVGTASSIFKYQAAETNKERYELLVSILGTQAFGWEGEGFAEDELLTTRQWLRSKANSIEGGTSEIQLNIIAKRVLGLPD